MDLTRMNRMKTKLNLTKWKDITQPQFNDLMTNLSSMDQESVRHIIKDIPDLASKIRTYFKDLQEAFGTNHKDYLEALKNHNELLCKMLDKQSDANIRNKIADSLLDHSKWLQREATNTRIFRMVMSTLGVGLAFVLVRMFNPFKSAPMKLNLHRSPNFKLERSI